MQDSNEQKIKQKILAILAKAKSTNNESEAEAFLAKAAELMQAHQLDAADIADAADPLLKHVGVEAAESGHAWRWKLYSAVAQLYGCKSVHVSKLVKGKNGRLVRGYQQVLVGRESAIITTDLMYPWLVQQVKDSAKRLASISGMSEQGQAKRVAAALIVRIYALVSAQQEQPPTTAAGRNALVVLDQVAAKYGELFPDAVVSLRGSGVTDALAKAAAENINLHRQTGTHSALTLEHVQ